MDNTFSYNKYINNAPDDEIWKPFSESEKVHFQSLVMSVRVALEEGDRHQKGLALESLMTYVYQRFDEIAVIHYNLTSGDNQIDHMIEFVDGLTPTFIHKNIGLRIIGESKNHKKAIGVREVADLKELLRSKNSQMGIFSSYYSFSKKQNNLWHYAEGKRRKLALADKVFIIGFTLEELSQLIDKNFYTLIKQKYNCLIDETEDIMTEFLSEDQAVTYSDRLFCALKQLFTNEIINQDSFEVGVRQINEKYGQITYEY
ncbi:hypothetical protein FHS18_004030 [Paenibacillus phyllosphaerae]|uniref:Restriction endonuclease type IV Mrr domain-containing protein n=1 Tax=Paenibacillus phyllosphaerae TaxID=274593 RepID=A0A7W5B0E5_9BACL|nr:hypothetical protein [Paenibacillus phyllosphaerae]MBB3111962.1 hypothetical protein [Paenibacillus phyllosphaerae]